MTKTEMDSAETAAWKLLSFFALDPQQQRMLFGTAGQWFCREGSGNLGANYLLGCKVAAASLVLSLRDRFPLASAELEEVVKFLSSMPPSHDAGVWSFNAIDGSQVWCELRMLARQALLVVGLQVIQLKKPLVIEELIEVEGFRVPQRTKRP
jgi:hypothetical protein